MTTCLECDRKVLARGLCNKHYYSEKRKSTNPRDIEIYQNKPKIGAARRWKSKTPEEREAYRIKYKENVNRRRDKILDYIPNTCALSVVSPCLHTKGRLHRDHDHSCLCGKIRGCKNCFRGLLCHYHNTVVMPVFEAMSVDYLPEFIKVYLENRPLKDVDFEIPVVG